MLPALHWATSRHVDDLAGRRPRQSWIGYMDFSHTIEVTFSSTRGVVTLNRPDKLNPLSTTTLAELVDAARFFRREA